MGEYVFCAAVVVIATFFAWRTWRKARRGRGLKGQYEIEWRRGRYLESAGTLMLGIFSVLNSLLRDSGSPRYNGNMWATPSSILTLAGLAASAVMFMWGFRMQANAVNAAIDEQIERKRLQEPDAPPDVVP